jgi:hypothetical protein
MNSLNDPNASPFTMDFDALTMNFSTLHGVRNSLEQDISDPLMDFENESFSPEPKKRRHRRSSSEPLPSLSGLEYNLEDCDMDDIFQESQFAGLLAQPVMCAALSPSPEPPTPVTSRSTFERVEYNSNFLVEQPILFRSHCPSTDFGPCSDNPADPTTSSPLNPFVPPTAVHTMVNSEWVIDPAIHGGAPETVPNRKTKPSSRSKGYSCGRCGQPKRGHRCPFVNRAVTSSSTQVDFSTQSDFSPYTGGHYLVVKPRSIV